MKVVADLHIHSKYSRAVSQQMVIPEIAKWAVKKGINLMGTGDFTHPVWLRELKANLEESGEGIYKQKLEAGSSEIGTRFILTAEISSIYSQGGKLRRIHNLIIAPNFNTVDKIIAELQKRGANLMSDGRPIIGMSARDLTALVLSVDKNALIIPCHVWTPWFSLYGSMSGFDSIDECFGDMAKYIYGIETGLSSDPLMNWRIKELDNRSILSSSDAHSGVKLGREATVLQDQRSILRLPSTPLRTSRSGQEIKDQNGDFKLKFNYSDIILAIKKDPNANFKIAHTIEFHPEEGKYHFTGHRNCHVRQSPEETKKLGTTCPVCGKPLTIGVMHRVEKLSQHLTVNSQHLIDKNGVKWISYDNRPPYVMLVPLLEIIAEAEGVMPGSQKVAIAYNNLINNLGSEFKILLKVPIEQIEKTGGSRIAEGVKKVRGGNIVVEPGYDGEFGRVKIWGREEETTDRAKTEEQKQMSLF